MARRKHTEKTDQNNQNTQKNRAFPYGKNSPEYVIARRRKRLRDKNEISMFLTRLVIMIIFLYILFGRIFGLALVENDDMKPRLSGGDLILYYRLQNTWNKDDVVVLKKDGKQYLGRIAATGNTSVDIADDGGLILNTYNEVEPDIYYITKKYDNGIKFPVSLDVDEFFILCDYREGAKDSRIYGPVEASELKGKVITVLRRSSL